MARIQRFEPRSRDGRRQPTEVVCGWSAFDIDGERLVQLDTYGSAERANAGKQSQTIQLDRAAASELVSILRRSFPGL